MLIRMLTGNIPPCFSRRPDEPSTALHHHLANRDHWHHKETGVDRGPAIIAPSFTPIATTAQREQTPFPNRPRPRPKTCEGCAWRRAARAEDATRCIVCILIMVMMWRGHTWGTRPHRRPRSREPCCCSSRDMQKLSSFRGDVSRVGSGPTALRRTPGVRPGLADPRPAPSP